MVPECGTKNAFMTPRQLNSHTIAHQNKKSAPTRSREHNHLSRSTRMEVPSEMRKLGKDNKIRILPAEEVITLKSGTATARKEIRDNLCSTRNWKKEFSTSSSRNQIPSNNTFRKSSSSIPASRFAPSSLPNGATKPQGAQTHDSYDDAGFHPPKSKRKSFEGAEDRPGKKVVHQGKESDDKTLAIDAVKPSKEDTMSDMLCSDSLRSSSQDKKLPALNIPDTVTPCQEIQALRSKIENRALSTMTDKLGIDSASPSSPSRKLTVVKDPDAVAPSRELQGLSSKTQNLASSSMIDKLGPDSKPPLSLGKRLPEIKDPGAILASDSSPNRTKVQENHLNRKSSIIQKCPQNGPAMKAIWKGSFEICSFPSNVSNYEGISAHPSAKVSRRAHEFSKELEKALQFTTHPQSEYWPKTFKIESPDKNDIGLYFYPGNYERSKRQYAYLLKFLVKKEMMLRSCMDGVQLLVFPSSILQVDSQKLDGSYFMWGIFRVSKGNSGTCNPAPPSLPTVS